MAFCDFVIQHTEDDSELTKRILYSIWIKRLKANKPVNIFIGGDSGEGKSIGALKIQETLCNIQKIQFLENLEIMNVFTPLEYPQKIEKLLHDKIYKKINIITIHESRDLVRAKNWQTFMTQAIADVNAQARSIKRLMTIIVSQFIRDITTDMRYTLNYYCIVRRPKNKNARLYINALWKDDRDLEKPKLRKRKLSGYIIKNGRYQRYVPEYLELSKPQKEAVILFEELDKKAKADIIRKKLYRLISEMTAEIGEENKKVESMIEWYTKDIDRINTIGKIYRGKWKVKTEVKEMHNLSNDELKEFETNLNKRIKEKGLFKNTEDNFDILEEEEND